MAMRVGRTVLLLVTLVGPRPVLAQNAAPTPAGPVVVTTRVEPKTVTIGTPFRYTMRVEATGDVELRRAGPGREARGLLDHGLRSGAAAQGERTPRRGALVHPRDVRDGGQARPRSHRSVSRRRVRPAARRRSRRPGDRAEPSRQGRGNEGGEGRARHQGTGRRAARLPAPLVGVGGASGSRRRRGRPVLAVEPLAPQAVEPRRRRTRSPSRPWRGCGRRAFSSPSGTASTTYAFRESCARISKGASGCAPRR